MATKSSGSPIPVHRTSTFARQLKGLSKKYRGLERLVNAALAKFSATGKVGLPIPSILGHSVFKVKLGVNQLGKRRGVRMICAVGRGRGWALYLYARKSLKGVPSKDLMTTIRDLPEDP